MKQVAIEGKLFELYIGEKELQARIRMLAEEIKEYYDDIYEEPIHIIVMMNGAFVFAADLVRQLDFPLHMYFVKSSSYVGLSSKGQVEFVLPEDLDIKNRRVLVLEDIVDTGITFQQFLSEVIEDHPKDLKICSLLVKNKNSEIKSRVNFVGFEIDDPFVIGYGMDFNGKARDFSDIYILKEDEKSSS